MACRPEPPRPGYHITPIAKGVMGESSKILEEVLELLDAEKQGCRIMMLVELADLQGAIKAFVEKQFRDMDVHDLEAMRRITERAFVNGHRG